ncbi:MAG: hypothetical protein II920_07280 [Clostridia bacterium]|nr:hypothetical protein [Clostridia bacterium]
MYCPRCKLIVDESKCPECNKPTREPVAEDICLLTVQSRPFAEMLSDVLEQNGVPNMIMASLGAGITSVIGSNLERTKVFTAYSDRDKALELTDELFGGASEVADDELSDDENEQITDRTEE